MMREEAVAADYAMELPLDACGDGDSWWMQEADNADGTDDESFGEFASGVEPAKISDEDAKAKAGTSNAHKEYLEQKPVHDSGTNTYSLTNETAMQAVSSYKLDH